MPSRRGVWKSWDDSLGAGQQGFGLIEAAQVEGQVDAQGQGVGIGVGQRRQDALDVVFDLGPFQEKLDDSQAAVAVVGVGRDEAIEILNDVRVPVREVGECPGEKVVMSQSSQFRERMKLGVDFSAARLDAKDVDEFLVSLDQSGLER